MANLFAQNTANWNAANQWNTVANGSGSYQTPGASDVCMANGKTVTVNISPTVSEVRNDTTGGATTGGSFTLSNGVTLTANCYGGSSNCVTYAGTVGNSANIVGNVYGSSSGVYAAHNSSTGTLNITGNSTGGSGNNGYTINNNSTGTINITGTLTAGSGVGSNGAFNNVSGTIAITGSVVGGSNSGAYGINNSSSGTVTISGNSTGGSLGHGCYVLSTGVTTISGYAIANNYPNESLTAGSNGVYNNSTSNAAVKVGGTKTGTGGFPAVYGRHFFAAGGVQAAYLYDGNAGNAVNLNGVAQSYPNAADVRYGTQYNANSQTGTLRVPAAASVLYGALVDNTSGTATLAASDIRAAVGLASANLDTQLSTLSGYVDTEVAAIKAKTDNLPADTNTLLTSTGIKVASIANGAIAAATFASGALDAVWSVASRTLTAISDSAGITTLLSRIGSALTISGGKVTVGTNDDKNGYALATTPPTAAQIRTEMDANSTKLANLDATISSRLAAADYGDVDLSAVLTAIAALHDFDPATDTVAHVTLVDTTTTLTNAPDVPTESEIADAVRTELTPELAAVLAMETRMAEQVPTGPVIVIPPPGAGQTTAWIVCYDETGKPEPGVTITITCTKASASGAFDAGPVVLTSDEDGLASGEIPRGTGLAFSAKRGKNGNSVRFAGVDADTLALPPLLGSP